VEDLAVEVASVRQVQNVGGGSPQNGQEFVCDGWKMLEEGQDWVLHARHCLPGLIQLCARCRPPSSVYKYKPSVPIKMAVNVSSSPPS
jgi:hypothetical protein